MPHTKNWRQYNRLRAFCQNKGVEVGLAAARDEGLPEQVIMLLTLVSAWSAQLVEFQAHCAAMAADDSLYVFWRALAAEHLAGSTPEVQVELRMRRNHDARELVVLLPADGEDYLYLWYKLRVGCNETGDRHQRDRYREATLWMITHGVRDAPRRAIRHGELVPDERVEMLNLVLARSTQPDCNFVDSHVEEVLLIAQAEEQDDCDTDTDDGPSPTEQRELHELLIADAEADEEDEVAEEDKYGPWD